MRAHAADTAAFDAFANQWFYQWSCRSTRSTTPGSRSGHRLARRRPPWCNAGTGTMPVEVAAVAGERFPDAKSKSPKPWRRAGTTVTLAAGQKASIAIDTAFEPERLVVDPDITVLMLNRGKAEVKLKTEGEVVAAR